MTISFKKSWTLPEVLQTYRSHFFAITAHESLKSAVCQFVSIREARPTVGEDIGAVKELREGNMTGNHTCRYVYIPLCIWLYTPRFVNFITVQFRSQ